MARRAFFSFHYQRDITRAQVVRNSWVTQDRESAGFWDCSLSETEKKYGEAAVKRLINDGLQNTSATVVLIGAETYSRKWVRYEIEESVRRRNGLLGVYIHSIPDMNRRTDFQGPNPFDYIQGQDSYGRVTPLSNYFQTYDWARDNGYQNLGYWIEKAAQAAGR